MVLLDLFLVLLYSYGRDSAISHGRVRILLPSKSLTGKGSLPSAVSKGSIVIRARGPTLSCCINGGSSGGFRSTSYSRTRGVGSTGGICFSSCSRFLGGKFAPYGDYGPWWVSGSSVWFGCKKVFCRVGGLRLNVCGCQHAQFCQAFLLQVSEEGRRY